jgi:acyl carrier protein
MPSIENRLIEFLRTLTGQAGLCAGTELIEEGIADSLTMMDLMVFIETELAVRLDLADLNAEVFRNPATLAAVIERRLASTREARAA